MQIAIVVPVLSLRVTAMMILMGCLKSEVVTWMLEHSMLKKPVTDQGLGQALEQMLMSVALWGNTVRSENPNAVSPKTIIK